MKVAIDFGITEKDILKKYAKGDLIQNSMLKFLV